ncbi:MAG: hypothetical protein EBZ24_06490 [Synechococcaceae bacterium WB9_4xB_025]|nr:hypothetical protein [Synechococcaceae bacterium WB9_4xB_025]
MAIRNHCTGSGFEALVGTAHRCGISCATAVGVMGHRCGIRTATLIAQAFEGWDLTDPGGTA